MGKTTQEEVRVKCQILPLFGTEMFQAKCVLILFIHFHSSHQVNQTAIDEKPGNLIMLDFLCYVCIFKNDFNM